VGRRALDRPRLFLAGALALALALAFALNVGRRARHRGEGTLERTVAEPLAQGEKRSRAFAHGRIHRGVRRYFRGARRALHFAFRRGSHVALDIQLAVHGSEEVARVDTVRELRIAVGMVGNPAGPYFRRAGDHRDAHHVVSDPRVVCHLVYEDPRPGVEVVAVARE